MGTVAATLLALALAVPVGGQGPVGEPSERSPVIQMGEEVSVQYVLVPVRVRSGDHLVPGLSAEHFRLWVDGRLLEPESFEQGARSAVDLVILQDLSGSMDVGAKMGLARRALRCLLERAQPGDRWALATFSTGAVEIAQPFTADLGGLGDRIDAFAGWGTTALRDAVAWLPDLRIAGGGPRQAAVVVTDGVDNASTVAPAEALRRVRSARLPVYTLALHHREPTPRSAGAPPSAAGETNAESEALRYSDVLRAMAEQTGGRSYDVVTPEQADRACAEIDHELRYQYVLGFSTSGAGSSRYRAFRVEVTGGSYQLSYRQGYEGRPPLGSDPVDD